LDHLGGLIEDSTKIVAGMAALKMNQKCSHISPSYPLWIKLNLHAVQILQYGLLELLFLFLGVGIVESNDELAVILLGIIVVEQCCFSVANVKEAGSFNKRNQTKHTQKAQEGIEYKLYRLLHP
jgi:hypothetical protein